MAELRTKCSRAFTFSREDIDVENRRVKLAFSSEEPVERWGENEVLSHEKGDFDFSRLNDSHPLLLGHNENNPDSQIGVVESAKVEGDKVGRAVVRFGNSAKAKEIFQDVVDGIRKHVSVGYDHTGIVNSTKAKDGRITTRYKWQPTHIALVPVPADTTVGVGRSAETVDSTHKPETNTIMDTIQIDETKIRKEAADAARAAAITDYKTRSKEIGAIADALIKDHGAKDGGKMSDKIRSLATEALQSDIPLADFKSRCLEDVLRAKPAVPVLIADCTEDPNRYSLMRGIQSAVRRASPGDTACIPDGLEGEVHQEMMRKAKANGGLGYEPSGFQVPCDAPVRMASSRRMGRDMQATVFAEGGAFVPTNLVMPVIEILRNEMILDKLGIRRMAGLTGNIVIPRQEAAATAYVVSEIGTLTDSGQILGQISLQPHRVGATQTYSKQFVMQSTPDAEAFLRDDLFKVIALQWDRLGINGQGASSEPMGVMNTPGINSITFGGSVTYINAILMETGVRNFNVVGTGAYVSTPSSKGRMKGIAEALTGATTIGGSQNAIWKPSANENESMVNGQPAWDTNQIPNNQMIYGVWDQLIQAMWGGIDVVVDVFTKAKNAETVITINTWGDFAVRHPQAFTVSADAANQ